MGPKATALFQQYMQLCADLGNQSTILRHATREVARLEAAIDAVNAGLAAARAEDAKAAEPPKE
jgi:hypothetical protein